ncbi:hypothetical protein C7C46_12475, partial [Streptomyces tateyamensis]
MKIASDPALIGFQERIGEPTAQHRCGCPYCARRVTARACRPTRRSGRISTLQLTVRSTCLATTVLAGAGVAGLSLGAGTARADSAPSHAGWDGSVYWFQNESGEWRYTKYYDTYVARTQKAGSSGSSGVKQGWDGSVYWFQNESGEWRYTKYYDTYVARTQKADSSGSSDSSGMKQGFDGSVYWFQNESGEWRYTKYYDTYLARTQQVSSANSSGSSG